MQEYRTMSSSGYLRQVTVSHLSVDSASTHAVALTGPARVQICAAKGQGKKRAAQQAGNQAQVGALSLTQHVVTLCVSRHWEIAHAVTLCSASRTRAPACARELQHKLDCR